MERNVDLNNLEQVGQARSAIRDLARNWSEEGRPHTIATQPNSEDQESFTGLVRAAAEHLLPEYVFEVTETNEPGKPRINILRKRANS